MEGLQCYCKALGENGDRLGISKLARMFRLLAESLESDDIRGTLVYWYAGSVDRPGRPEEAVQLDG